MTSTAPLVVLPPITLGDPAQLDLTAYRGDTGRFRVLVTQDGAPLDVSAATWDCDIRASEDGALMASMVVTPVSGTTNAVDVELPASATTSLSAFTEPGVWDLEMTLGTAPDVIVTTLLRGSFMLTADVSRAPFPAPPTGPATTGAPPAGSPVGQLPFRSDPGPLVVHGFEDSGRDE